MAVLHETVVFGALWFYQVPHNRVLKGGQHYMALNYVSDRFQVIVVRAVISTETDMLALKKS